MAGATNKSAKRLGYTKAQIQTERAKGGVLSHAALLASGAPARPTKAHKALVEAMDARKQGLTRKAEPPAGWKAAARGEGAEGRAAARGAREAFVQKRDAAVKRDALVARTAKNIGDVSRIARGMQQKQAADAQAKAAADAKQAQIGRTARALGDASKIARATRQANAERIRKDAPARAAHEAAVTAERQKAMKTFMGSAKKVDRMIAETAKGDDNGAQVRRMIASLENRSGRPEIRGNSATYSEISRLKKSLVAAEDAGRKARDGQRSETAAARRAAQGFAPMRELLGR